MSLILLHGNDNAAKRDFLNLKRQTESSVVWAAATLLWFYCNDNPAKRDFESQTAYSQFGMDILIRSGKIYYR